MLALRMCTASRIVLIEIESLLLLLLDVKHLSAVISLLLLSMPDVSPKTAAPFLRPIPGLFLSSSSTGYCCW